MGRRLTRLALDAIRAYHRALRGLGCWFYARTLPPRWTSRLYRRLYARQFDANKPDGE